MADEPPLFALEGVCQERGGRVVLRDVTLAIPARRVVALIGPSGSGKTSLLRLLDRLDDPTAGTVRVHGRPATSYPVRELRRRIGFVFQTPTMFDGTVADNLRAAAALLPGSSAGAAPVAADDASLARLLAAVELDADYLHRDAARLSGGEQQRVGIARALVSAPEALLLDEPTSALDPEVAERFLATLVRLNRERGLSLVMVTHRLAEARATSDVTVMMDGGRVVEVGPTARIFAAAREERTRAFTRLADT